MSHIFQVPSFDTVAILERKKWWTCLKFWQMTLHQGLWNKNSNSVTMNQLSPCRICWKTKMKDTSRVTFQLHCSWNLLEFICLGELHDPQFHIGGETWVKTMKSSWDLLIDDCKAWWSLFSLNFLHISGFKLGENISIETMFWI